MGKEEQTKAKSKFKEGWMWREKVFWKNLHFLQQVSPSYQCTQMRIAKLFFSPNHGSSFAGACVVALLMTLNPQIWFWFFFFFIITTMHLGNYKILLYTFSGLSTWLFSGIFSVICICSYSNYWILRTYPGNCCEGVYL